MYVSLFISKEEMKDVTVQAIRTNCCSDKSEQVTVTLKLQKDNNLGFIVDLMGGSTGYESFIVSKSTIEQMSEKGWLACMGFPKRWDRLEVPANEMIKAFNLWFKDCPDFDFLKVS